MTTEKQLLNFIDKARKKGLSDLQIKNILVANRFPVRIVDKAFRSLNPKFKSKNQICIFLSNEIIEVLEKKGEKEHV